MINPWCLIKIIIKFLYRLCFVLNNLVLKISKFWAVSTLVNATYNWQIIGIQGIKISAYISIATVIWLSFVFMGGKIYGWKLIENKIGKGIWNQKKKSLWLSTNDFTSYGQSPILIRSIVFTWLTNKKKNSSLYTVCIDMRVGDKSW